MEISRGRNPPSRNSILQGGGGLCLQELLEDVAPGPPAAARHNGPELVQRLLASRAASRASRDGSATRGKCPSRVYFHGVKGRLGLLILKGNCTKTTLTLRRGFGPLLILNLIV